MSSMPRRRDDEIRWSEIGDERTSILPRSPEVHEGPAAALGGFDRSTALMLESLRALSLVEPRQQGALEGALCVLLRSVGCSRGAVYLLRGDFLELEAEVAMPIELQMLSRHVRCLGTPWFIAQEAAQRRRVVIDRAFALRCGGLESQELVEAGWSTVVACPLVAGRELVGVILIAAPATEDFSIDTIDRLRIGCHANALHASHESPRARRSAPAFPTYPRDAPTRPAMRAVRPPEESSRGESSVTARHPSQPIPARGDSGERLAINHCDPWTLQRPVHAQDDRWNAPTRPTVPAVRPRPPWSGGSVDDRPTAVNHEPLPIAARGPR